jgi:DNA-directed RNA polymerase specialized sigma24 family protein
MTRDELARLRDAIDAALALPDAVRIMLAKWLSGASSGNGLDHSPPLPSPSPSKPAPTHNAKPVQRTRQQEQMIAQAREDERALLVTIAVQPGLSARALARASGGKVSTVGQRLARMAQRGEIAKGEEGGWLLAEARPTPPPSS